MAESLCESCQECLPSIDTSGCEEMCDCCKSRYEEPEVMDRYAEPEVANSLTDEDINTVTQPEDFDVVLTVDVAPPPTAPDASLMALLPYDGPPAYNTLSNEPPPPSYYDVMTANRFSNA